MKLLESLSQINQDAVWILSGLFGLLVFILGSYPWGLPIANGLALLTIGFVGALLCVAIRLKIKKGGKARK